MIQAVEEKPNKFVNVPFSYSDNSSRAFNCNAILFINSGTANVFINDIFLLIPGASLELSGNKNEIDTTIYKITFASVGTKLLQGWIAYDNGISVDPAYPPNAFYTKEPPKKGFRSIGSPIRRGRDMNNKVRGKKKIEF